MNYDGSLALVIETTEIRIRKFYEANEDFALAEGQNDTRDDWRANHLSFFEEVVRMLDQLGATLRVVSFLTANNWNSLRIHQKDHFQTDPNLEDCQEEPHDLNSIPTLNHPANSR